MSRRDTIILAVLVNGGLLAILFLMAAHVESDRPTGPHSSHAQSLFDSDSEISFENGGSKKGSSHFSSKKIPDEPVKDEPVKDEIDYAIQHFEASEDSQSATSTSSSANEGKDYFEVTVKRGDFLEKIANANGSTVSAIKKANKLESDRLSIGQVLRIPKEVSQTKSEDQVAEKGSSIVEEEWYTVEPGDNPWKIAKKFNVRFDKLLDLNNLDEDKARNLRAGDRLRVR